MQAQSLDKSALLSANAISCERGERLLFRGITFALRPGEMLHVCGANGSGKTSLLRILAGLLLPVSGDIDWCGSNIQTSEISYRQIMSFHGHKLGVKAQLTVLENLQLFAQLNGAGDSDLEHCARQVGLQNHLNDYTGELSAGQNQRLALARLLLKKSTLWILDEPFTALDTAGINVLQTLLQQHIQQQGMVIITTHLVSLLQAYPLQKIEL